MSVDSHVDPLDKMRARDVNKVARVEQAPRPAHEYGTVSAPPPPSAVDSRNNQTERENEDYSKEVDDEV
ncbi:putative cytochrome c oxidase subunit 6b-like [Morella rubra]|uniref:Putative cytochrome c oxidase subunit 6b-like n=1 Tax=Morella rubra TaxID=262757 RepID=A0A6A1VUX4_9ROSI|nr:putative cytochrome c oxidase subunit 6b-like [Morella rubra]